MFDRTGAHSVNLGDNMQSLAVRHLYRCLGIPAERIVRIDRDRLAQYDGPPVVLPMNAVSFHNCLPAAPNVIPLFIGFHAAPAVIRARRGWLARHGTIVCRDPATAAALRQPLTSRL